MRASLAYVADSVYQPNRLPYNESAENRQTRKKTKMVSQEIRWKLRFDSLKKAFSRLESACVQEKYNELELAGLVQTFQFTFELCWKTLKDLMTFEGYEVNSPRETIRKAFELSLIDDAEPWFNALENRNILTHVYNEAMAEQARNCIKNIFEPMLRECVNSLNERIENNERRINAETP